MVRLSYSPLPLLLAPNSGQLTLSSYVLLYPAVLTVPQSALFNFHSLLRVVLLIICTCTYVRATAPALIDRNKEGFLGVFFKSARIGTYLLL
ncbi:hypothetical protein [Sporisorium scitamineum]|uniref:Protein kish n=1 Tax=Sporisorium scitamineum TaxID=49012 RepID=A0A0F7S0F7_9BASI|nr:hypothetical protein [Sporisorium scitamineum]